jgi:metalloendopeptidase OMA1, mitochondrial
MKTVRALIRGLTTVIVVVVFLSCTTVPETGRHQLRLISPSQEMQLGLSSFEQMKKEVPISRDRAANELVQRVGKRIAGIVPSTEMPNAQWEFVVFESKEVNAFCLPGGKVGVYTGILPITKDEAGLATVIGHEVAHASLHHGAERMSEALALQGAGQLLGAGLSGADPRWQQAAGMAFGLGATFGRQLPHSRLQESEADKVGMRYMARAGYNPRAAVQFWERFKAYNERAGESGTPEFFRTHPTDEHRIAALQEELARLTQGAQGSPGVNSQRQSGQGSQRISSPR